jgi:very-short-patch-repair endonuclease
MTTPLPPEREGSTRRRRAGEGLSRNRQADKAYDLVPTQRSRQLRNNATPAERKLWAALGNRQLGGVRFNRQVVIRPYICDLVARSEKLVIEIDGGQHGAAVPYDDARTAFLEARGYRVLRFWNNEVLGNIEGVVSRIESVLNDRPSPSRLRRSSPPALAGGAE